MSTCKTLIRTSLSLSSFEGTTTRRKLLSFPLKNLNPISLTLPYSPFPPLNLSFLSCRSRPIHLGFGFHRNRTSPLSTAALCIEPSKETPNDLSKDTVEELLSNADDVSRSMKLERRSETHDGEVAPGNGRRWFPYLDRLRCGDADMTSREVIDALSPCILESRMERMRTVAENRSYSVCLVVEGLSDLGNVSAAFRSADALGIQSVHVVSGHGTKRYRDNRHVSMGAEKWLDIELWESTQDCFKVLKSRGYRIATTHLGTDMVSIYDMDWSCPTAIVVGNEHRGISDDALELSDLHCSIPMKGMVDSFNVSVAAGIVMHHAVYDRMSRLGRHGDLMPKECQILLAEFSLRHSKSAIRIAQEYAKRLENPASKL
ncbi:hypothetical protein MRB53_007022 [Persea americana]|uniref:Uncharacterized protein n=1 Tax=Persea americana TaxID=3435 RepID=A0ACC2MI30_PERAE|nr:hypothetical protein MRB53_007022 [Persea americana]|eukprot:TRINITY_DN5518_c1_g1_i4.p1 TRINITY_DN5518_c1_g1~~TRINITY_DN5518_c1_g1_i4.p1  ORF type:complete len:409 (+),score=56.16 TRINITY_DN5518_c1_g1_i4:108-1229(+)